MDELICPMMSGTVSEYCKKDRCAWWYPSEKCCAMVLAAASLCSLGYSRSL